MRVADGIESAVRELISKVEASQSTIDYLEEQVRKLKLQIESQDIAYKKSIFDIEMSMRHSRRLEDQLERYFLISRKQSEIIQSFEALQRRSSEIIYSRLL